MSSFYAVFFMSIFVFGQSYYVLTFNIDEKKSLMHSIMMTYKQAIGETDFSAFDNLNKNYYLVLWFLNTFVSLIILLNLIVALLSDTFD